VIAAGAPDHPAVAATLGEECMGRSWSFDEAGMEQRQVVGARRCVIHEARGQQPFRVSIADALHEHQTDTPGHTTVQLGLQIIGLMPTTPAINGAGGVAKLRGPADRIDALWHPRRPRYLACDRCGHGVAHAMSGAKAQMTHRGKAQRKASFP
jgi:hypothetical protein